MKRKRSTSPEPCVVLLEPSIADCLRCYPYLWNGHKLEVKTSKGKTKTTKTFRRLKDMYQKILWDILDGMVSRLKKGQNIGLLTLQTVKIKDNVAYLPEVSEPEQVLWHPAQQYYNLVVALLGTDGTITERDSFYKILESLIKSEDRQKYISGLEALRFHRLLHSSKENNSFVGDALDKLKGVRVPVRGGAETVNWKEAFGEWSIGRSYNIKAAIRGNSYFLEVYFYRKSYPHSCIGVLKFIKNICKHLNENRARDGEIEWSEEELENFFDYYFPEELTNFFEFLWYKDLPVNFRNSGKQIPPVYLMQANNGKFLNLSGVIGGTTNDQTTIYTHLATRELQTIKNSDLEFIKELGSGTYRTRHYGKWMGSNVVIQKINQCCFTDSKLKDRSLDDFWKEVHVLGQLNHPNILTFYGVVTDGQGKDLATVTEYMVHGSLEKVLQSNDLTIDEEKKLLIAIDAAVGLDYLHEKNIALFDFKSRNLLLDMRDEKRPICKIGNLELSDGEQTTVPWMAPELLNHNNNVNVVTEKVYAYSFGVVLRELLTGEISAAGIHPQIPAECSNAWKFVMESCWLHDPKARPQFSEMLCFLRSMLAATKITKMIGRRLEDAHLATQLQTIKNCDLEFIKELGAGTYGTVYLGKWKGSNVAIKKFKPSCFTDGTLEDRLLADFWQEAHVLGQLHHPNIVAFYGVVTDGPVTNLATVTEYMVNGSLKQVLRRKDRTIDPQKRLIIAMDAAFAMEYLHEKSIVHFDLKSHNFLVDMRDPQKSVCKIGNLGLSKIKQRTLVSGGVPGTVPWMAPELLKGHRKHNFVTEKVDVYSFGIVMWELLTGEEPYADLRSEEIIADIIKGSLRPEIPSWCDPTWSSLMERCWSSDPDSRPPFSKISKELRAMSAAMNIK